MTARKYFVTPGDRFGRLTVLRETRLPHPNRNSHELAAVCLCDCGNEVTVLLGHLFIDRTKSCGCLRTEMTAERGRVPHPTHGMSRHPLYPTWVGMMARCYNPKATGYARYGGRGIEVSPRWHDVRLFVEDIESLLGPRPAGKTSDRHASVD